MNRKIWISVGMILLGSIAVKAEENSISQGGGRERRPPREALEACQGKASGTACEFKGRSEGQVKGTCWSPEESLPLACKPSHAPNDSSRQGPGPS